MFRTPRILKVASLVSFELGATRALLVALALQATPVASQTSPPPLRIGFVYVSPIGSSGWSYEHERGRQHLEKALAGRVTTTFVEDVAAGSDAERVMNDLVAQGNRLIFATSFSYVSSIERVAAAAPTVRFELAGGQRTSSNLATYNARLYEARWLAGMLAGHTSTSGIAGYVAGFPVPEVIQGINAFTLGMRAVNPKASVRVIWVNNWFDPARERDAARFLVNGGADVLTNHSGSAAVPLVAEEMRVKLIAYQSDMRRIAPRAQLAAITADWGLLYVRLAESALEENWKPSRKWVGMSEGLVQLAAMDTALPQFIQSEVARHRAALVSGSVGPFFGRLVDQSGRVRQASGGLDDSSIDAMDWFVEGVQGTLPSR